MCEICNNSVNRDYSHSKHKHHQKLLMKVMKIKQLNHYYNNQPNYLTSAMVKIPQQQP